MENSGGGIVAVVVSLVMAAMFIVCIVGVWKMFTKAGQPGWGSLIPFYNVYLLLKIAEKPGWWLVLFCIPFVNLYALVVVSINIAKAFGKGIGFAIGLILLNVPLYAFLGFGKAQYVGVSGNTPTEPMPDRSLQMA